MTFSNCWGEGGHGYPEKKKSCWEVFNGNLAKMIRLIEENHGSKRKQLSRISFSNFLLLADLRFTSYVVVSNLAESMEYCLVLGAYAPIFFSLIS